MKQLPKETAAIVKANRAAQESTVAYALLLARLIAALTVIRMFLMRHPQGISLCLEVLKQPENAELLKTVDETLFPHKAEGPGC